MKIARSTATFLLLAALPLSGCKTTDDKEKTSKTAATKKPEPTTLRDQSGDVAFQSFLSRLRQAVKRHDTETIAMMMIEDFGYSYEPGGEGPGVFKYWDDNNVWPELQLVLNESFVPKGKNFMVAPPEFVTQTNRNEPYTGYRAGIMLQNGSWKFAFFVKGEDPADQEPAGQ